MPYQFIEHTADIAAEISANSIEDLFSISCCAWRDAALEIDESSLTDERTISLCADSFEELLVQLLNELNFLLSTKHWVFNSVKKIEFLTEEKSNKLFIIILGEPFDKNFHHFKEEIKAVTFHQMKIEKNGDEYSTRIVFDI